MAELEARNVMKTGFLKKEKYTGSCEGMRFRFEKAEQQDEQGESCTVLRVSHWPEPYAYEHTEPAKIKEAFFPFTDEGVEQGRCWLNEERRAWYWG